VPADFEEAIRLRAELRVASVGLERPLFITARKKKIVKDSRVDGD